MSSKKQKAIAALISQSSISDAARTAGIGSSTLFRWLQTDDAFKQAYKRAKREVVAQAVTMVQGAMSKAVENLVKLMNDTTTPASSRVAASRTIMDFGLRLTEIENLEARIEEIEKSINKRSRGRK